jgi:cell division septation protein DedD
MTIDLVPHIEKLLYSHPTLVVPGLGAFQTTKTEARPDAISGVVNPPARTLSFNENLTVDDGLLTEDIAQTHQISTEKAREIVQQFVEQTHDLLSKREIVTLPGIGRLYRNYVQKIQFLPDSTNFNTDAYGLPPLQFSPITRARETAESAQPAPATQTQATAAAPSTPTPTYIPEEEKDPSRWLPLLGVGILLLLVGAGYFYIRSLNQAKKDAAGTSLSQTETPAAETPAAETAPAERETATLPTPGTEERPAAKPAPAPPKVKENTAPAKPSAGGRRCIIVIGQFKDPANIAQLKEKLTANGFQVYQAPGKTGQQIGVQFNYQNVRDIQQNLNTLEKLTGVSDLWIKQK